jgi:anthranilate phosphoribosyltransferase
LTAGRFEGWKSVLGALAAGETLSSEQAGAAMAEILRGDASAVQVAAFVFGMRCRGETDQEMSGMVGSMVAASERVVLPPAVLAQAVDTCGTGGDRSGTFNVSTAAALVIAGCGVPVCKHGGRAASSKAGSADVLEALDVAIDLGPSGVARCVLEAGIGFCFAPRFHHAMRHAIPVRRELGVPTAFNFLGPLANPARVRRQVVGVGDAGMASKMVRVLAGGGAEHVMVVHGHPGLDELSTVGPSTLHEYRRGASPGEEFKAWTFDPAQAGLAPAVLNDLAGGDAAENASIIVGVLSGAKGPRRDIVVLNAAAGLVVAGRCQGISEGIELAAAAIDDGRAQQRLDRLVNVSQRERLGGDA